MTPATPASGDDISALIQRANYFVMVRVLLSQHPVLAQCPPSCPRCAHQARWEDSPARIISITVALTSALLTSAGDREPTA